MNKLNNDIDKNVYALGSALGDHTNYNQPYSPDILYPIARAAYRETVEDLYENMSGKDIWQCYELSWLNEQGKPEVRLGAITVPSDSPHIIESKSLKLYLNSLNQCTFATEAEYIRTVQQDLGEKIGADVLCSLTAVDYGQSDLLPKTVLEKIPGQLVGRFVCIDHLDVSCEHYYRERSLIAIENEKVVSESLCSHMLRSNCPVTHQPDWATLSICYSGNKLNKAQLLKYIVSFRLHSGFHEQCVEQIYSDLMHVAQCDALTVSAQYTRRGGIDINPYRSSQMNIDSLPRVNRQ